MFVQDTGSGPTTDITSNPPVGYTALWEDQIKSAVILTLPLTPGKATWVIPTDEVFVECSDCGRNLLGRQVMDRDWSVFDTIGLSDLCDDCVGSNLASTHATLWEVYAQVAVPDYNLWWLKQETALSRGQA